MTEQVQVQTPAPNPAPKPAWESATIQGLALAVLGMVLQALGYHMDPGGMGALVGDVWTLGGLAMATWGRTRAQGPLIWKAPKAPSA
jgi:hypothetical protein